MYIYRVEGRKRQEREEFSEGQTEPKGRDRGEASTIDVVKRRERRACRSSDVK